MLYTVKYGDSISSVAAAHRISPASLSAANQLDPHIRPVAGQTLVIPDTTPPLRSITVHGCIGPGTGDAALAAAAPYLSCVSLCGARLQCDGSVTLPSPVRSPAAAQRLGITPLLNISNRFEGGDFSSSILHSFLGSTDCISRFSGLIKALLASGGYCGINAEFRGVMHEDLCALTDFFLSLSGWLHSMGAQLYITVSDTEYPNSTLCGCADSIILRTCAQDITHTSPSPICPIGAMRSTLERAVAKCNPRRLILRLPLYGRNWTLPCRAGRADILYPGEIPALAYSHYADIRYDDTAQAPFFSYYDSIGTEHTVWFHDPRSIAARLHLAEEFGIGGICMGNIAPFYRPGWLTAAAMYEPHKLG